MSITAEVEVEGGELLPLTSYGTGSKAIATFIEALSTYCDDENVDDSPTEVVEWFSTIEARMTENLCTIQYSTYGFWDYSLEEYERFVDDMKENGVLDIPSKEEFVQTYQEIEQKWIDIILLHKSLDNLIRIIEELKPEQVWWYDEENTLSALKFFSKTLAIAIDRGFKRVRIYLS